MAERRDVNRAELAGAGVLGFCGVAASAASAHAAGDPRLMGAAGLVCLTHAAALLAFGFAGRHEFVLRLAALALFAGPALFSADMAMRAFENDHLFAYAAPAGGMTMMAGWLAVVVSVFILRRD